MTLPRSGRNCKKVSDYIYSSTSNYVHDADLVQIEKMGNPIVEVFEVFVIYKMQFILAYYKS